MPFDWKSPIGYLIAVLLELVVALYPMCYLGSFLSLAVGSFIFATAVTKDLDGTLASIKKLAKKKRQNSQLFKQFAKFYQLHTDLKQLSQSICIVCVCVHFIAILCMNQKTLCKKLLFSMFCILTLLRLLDYFSKIYEITLTVVFVGSVGAICLALLMLQMAIVQVIISLSHELMKETALHFL